jgi:hypothetical protein
MTYLPNHIFKNILAYCDDRIERKQKKLMNQVLNDLIGIYIDSYFFGEEYDDGEFYSLENYSPIKFCYTNKTETYEEIGMDWLVKQFHYDTIDCWKEWYYYDS